MRGIKLPKMLRTLLSLFVTLFVLASIPYVRWASDSGQSYLVSRISDAVVLRDGTRQENGYTVYACKGKLFLVTPAEPYVIFLREEVVSVPNAGNDRHFWPCQDCS